MTAPSLGLTSYTEQLAAYAGMLAMLDDGKHIVAARNGETSLEIPFGACVIRKASDDITPSSSIASVTVPKLTGFRAYGVVVHSHDYENGPNGTLGTTGLKPDAQMNIMRRGQMYVNTEDLSTEGLAAFARYTDNGANLAGNLRSDTDGGKAEEVLGIIWRTTRADAGLVLVDVDMVAYDVAKNI
jgi:hypothetical protein